MLPVELIGPVERVVADLAAGRFELLERDGRIGRVNADGVRRELGLYGRTLVPLPEEWPRFATLFASTDDGTRALDVDLWTAEEGRSDLTLQLEVRPGPDGEPIVTIQDLRAL